jgi:4-hydroxy-3-methylbut-2-enyl diphosphate reductase
MKQAAEAFEIPMNRKGFGNRQQMRDEVQDIYNSPLVDEIKAAGFTKSFGPVTVHLAKEYGFCYGVDRAVELAYETRLHYPDRKIFLTTEIIHNPTVNNDLRKMGIEFLSGGYQSATHGDVKPEDVVIVPAFGTTVSELKQIYDKGCEIVDTICGSVVTVWKRVEKYAREGYTSIIHGKYKHEETMATSSRVTYYDDAHYLIVLNQDEADYVCRYMLYGGDKKEFLEKFAKASSVGFDPDIHLKKLGFANQTTMLSSDSLHIAGMFKEVFVQKYGESYLKDHFMSFDTICSATQERQDAIISLKEKKPDLVLVIGGYNSSNTTHLNEIATTYAKSYHISRPECIVDSNEIRHKPLGQKEEVASTSWLPEGSFSVGVTAGASTPDKVMGDVIERVLELVKTR